MFQRILVPLDDTTRIAAALRIASAFALQTRAQLVLAQVEPNCAPAQDVMAARTALQREVNALRQQGIQAEYAVERGSRVDGIVAVARTRQVDVILLVPAQRQQLELVWYSRSATRLLNELPAPLLIWPESQPSVELLAAGDAAVMVPLDGTAEAERSLPIAVKVAEQYHRPLALVRALPVAPVQLHTGDSGRDGVHRVSCFSDHAEAAAAYLHDVGERLERVTWVPVYTGVVAGEPGSRLLSAANAFRAGVIILCSHSHPQPKERYFLGCVATQLLRQADVPVLIVPPQMETVHPAISHDVAASNGRLVAGVTV